jgi:hypothetical protein
VTNVDAEVPVQAGTSTQPLSDGPLPFGELLDLGLRDYREAACSKSTVAWLRQGGMTSLDGATVTLRVMDECPGGHNVIVRFWTQDV